MNNEWLDNNKKNIIDEAYHACMNHRATEEQELIWRLANAIHCIRIRLMLHDDEAVERILLEHDYDAPITHEEKIDLIKKDYNIGKIKKVHSIGEYQILEVVRSNGEIYWHGYVNYKETNIICDSLDCALSGCIKYNLKGK